MRAKPRAPLRAPRTVRFLTRLVLVWFVAYLGAAAASPVFAPKTIDRICSASGGIRLIVKNADGSQEERHAAMECSLCAAVALPPSVSLLPLVSQQPLAFLTQSIPAARLAAVTAAPLPPRGPPSLS